MTSLKLAISHRGISNSECLSVVSCEIREALRSLSLLYSVYIGRISYNFATSAPGWTQKGSTCRAVLLQCVVNNHSYSKQSNREPSNTMAQPWSLDDPRDLERWYNDNIQEGTDLFDRDCRLVVNKVVRNLQEICSSNGVLFDVDRVVKGGSLGKGTMVKDLSDVDLIAFINPPHLEPIATMGPTRYREKLKGIISDLVAALRKLDFPKKIGSDEFMVTFTITNIGPKGRSLKVDLLPTADNCLGYGHAHADMFRAMLQLSDSYDMEFYSASLAEHQLKFVGDQPGYLKELIRLVKYWAYESLPQYLCKSYPLELITIYRWETAGSPIKFSKAQGMKDVLQTLTNLGRLRHFWTNLHSTALANEAITKLQYVNPIMLDPANPTNNVCRVYQKWNNPANPTDNVCRMCQKWNNLSCIQDAASTTLQSDLMRAVDLYSNWRGPSG